MNKTEYTDKVLKRILDFGSNEYIIWNFRYINNNRNIIRNKKAF